jgi:hypothetical protein
MGTGMSTSKPTPQGISALLRKAGFDRAVFDRFTLTSGFRVTKDHRRDGTVRVDYRVAIRMPENAVRDLLAAYAKTITEAGWTVEAGTYELIVTAKGVRCAWCETDLAPADAKPIEYARLRDRPDDENMQCRDDDACRERQDRQDAELHARLRAKGLGFLITNSEQASPLAAKDGDPR